MAKSKKKSGAPVSTRVVNGVVQLSKQRLEMLSLIQNEEERARVRAVWEKKALESAAKNAAFMESRGQYGLKLSDDRKYLYANGIGGRRGGVFSKAGLTKFIQDLENVKAMLTQMVD